MKNVWTATHYGVALKPSKETIANNNITIANPLEVIPAELVIPTTGGLKLNSLFSLWSKHS